jgi:hypothetical protein
MKLEEFDPYAHYWIRGLRRERGFFTLLLLMHLLFFDNNASAFVICSCLHVRKSREKNEVDFPGLSISKSLSKFYSLDHHLESHLHENHFLYFSLSKTFLFLIRTIENHSRLLYLTRKKSEIKDDYI